MPLQLRDDGSGKFDTGRPSDYKEEYCKDIIEFFSRALTRTVDKTYTTKAGTVIVEKIEKPNELPTIDEYCNKLGITRQTLLNWTKDHSDFLEALTRAKQLEKDFLIKNGISGRFDKTWMFVAENFTDMRSKVQLTGSEDGPVIIQIVPPASSGAEIEVKVDK